MLLLVCRYQYSISGCGARSTVGGRPSESSIEKSSNWAHAHVTRSIPYLSASALTQICTEPNESRRSHMKIHLRKHVSGDANAFDFNFVQFDVVFFSLRRCPVEVCSQFAYDSDRRCHANERWHQTFTITCLLMLASIKCWYCAVLQPLCVRYLLAVIKL